MVETLKYQPACSARMSTSDSQGRHRPMSANFVVLSGVKFQVHAARGPEVCADKSRKPGPAVITHSLTSRQTWSGHD